MRIIVVDCEVFAHDWIVVFLDIQSQTWTVCHNDNQAVREYLSQPGCIFVGFNNKHYDNHILKAIACGAPPELVKQLSEFIITEERPGWEHYFLRQNRFWFDSFDLADDTQVGTSLKHIEAHLGYAIEETEVDFNLDRPLSWEEIESTVRYCKYDVLNTARLLTIRKVYLDTKLSVGRMIGLSDVKALYMTNARLTAAALKAEAQTRYDEREYQYPDNLRKEFIPDEVLRFFDGIHDKNVPNKDYFSSSIVISIGECEVKIGFGGIHAAIPNYIGPNKMLRNYDVASYYPSMMIKNGYISRNIPSPEIFKDMYRNRFAAKRSGDKKTADSLKLILNTTYGASLATTNPLYDPLMGRSTCISGQLYLLELAQHLYHDIPGLRIVQLNTDGIMIEFDDSQYADVIAILDEWQQRTGFELEEDKIKRLVQKDVNNYFLMFESGKTKTKGAYFSMGIAPAGAFSINNNFVIVKQAVADYFVKGTPVEETILGCDDIHKFQIIAKAGGGYKSVYRIPHDFEDRKKRWQKERRYRVVTRDEKVVWKYPPMRWSDYDGPRELIQKVNRVYASVLPDQGTIVKVKPDGTVGKIGGLPDSVVIDNKNTLTIASVDKRWYVNLAKKYIEDYTGESLH